MRACIFTIDVGTTAVKTAVFDRQMKCVCSATEEYSLITEDGHIEMDPYAYWTTIQSAARRMLRGREDVGAQIIAVVCTTQGETIIPVDEFGNALSNAIVWLDGRAQEQAERLAVLFPPGRLYPNTGVAELTGAVPVCKALWIKENMPDVYARVHKFLLLEDWILLKFTGRFVTEKVVLSSTGYYDIIHDCYYGEMLKAADIPLEKFPDILDVGTNLGTILPEAAVFLGVNPEARVFTGAMDQVAGAIAAGNYREGIVTETTGTAMAICATSSDPNFKGSQCAVVYRHAVKGKYLVISLCVTAGIVLKWFLDKFCEELSALDSPYDVLSDWAKYVPAGSDGLIILPYFTGIMTPESNPDARGAIFGLDLSMGKAHLARAIMESVGYMLKENLEILRRVTNHQGNEVYSFGGGSRSDVWLQIKADVCGHTIKRTDHSEGASLGVAAIVAVAMGWYELYEDALGHANQTTRTFLPNPNHAEVYSACYEKFRELYAALRPLFGRKGISATPPEYTGMP